MSTVSGNVITNFHADEFPAFEELTIGEVESSPAGAQLRGSERGRIGGDCR